MDLRRLIEKFLSKFNKNYIICNKDDLTIEFNAKKRGIYNEFSLQFELGMFLRSRLGKNYVVEFERNVQCFGLDKSQTVKKELDIVVFNKGLNKGLTEKYAIELKFPRVDNDGHTDELDRFEEDEKCVKALVNNGFNAAYQLVLTDDPLYIQKSSNKKGRPPKEENKSKWAKYRADNFWEDLQGQTKYHLYEKKGN